MENRFILIVVLISSISFGQNRLNITQYMMHQPFLNMASITANDNINAAGLHREQWLSFEGAPSSSMFSVNSPISQTNLSVGGIVSHDRIGVHSMTNIDLGLAYKIKLNKSNYLSFALKGGLVNTSSDYSQLNLQNINDPNFISGPSQIQPDIGFSSYFFSDKYYFGVAVPSLLRNARFYSEDMIIVPQDFHYFTTAGYQFTLNENFKLGFSTLIKGIIGAPIQADLNAQIMFNDFLSLGTSYRTSSDLAAIVGFKIKDRFTISYSYDFGFSDLARYHNNTHEIMLIFDAPRRELKTLSSPRY